MNAQAEIDAVILRLRDVAHFKRCGRVAATVEDGRIPVKTNQGFGGSDGKVDLHSIVYLPKYQMWSATILPRDFLLGQLYKSLVFYVITFCIIFGLAFWMFRRINRFEQISHQQLVDQASEDFLTGLKNRQFLRIAEAQWIHSGAEPFSVFFIDLDNFKNINDSHGHSYGDNLLKQVAGRLLSIAGKTDLVCRQGGDEFIVLSRRCDEDSIPVSPTRCCRP